MIVLIKKDVFSGVWVALHILLYILTVNFAIFSNLLNLVYVHNNFLNFSPCLYTYIAHSFRRNKITIIVKCLLVIIYANKKTKKKIKKNQLPISN